MTTPAESKPNPDPSTLTTAQLDKGLDALEKLLSARIHCSEENVLKVEESMSHRQESIDKTVAHLQALQDEKFKGVEKQFSERDTRTDKTAELNQKAIDAALTAAEKSRVTQNETSEKAIVKSEVAMIKQIDLQAALLQTETKSLYTAIEDLKARQNVIDGRGSGIASSLGFIVGGIGALSAAVAIIIAITPVRDKQGTSVAPQVVFVPSPPATMPSAKP